MMKKNAHTGTDTSREERNDDTRACNKMQNGIEAMRAGERTEPMKNCVFQKEQQHRTAKRSTAVEKYQQQQQQRQH